MPGLVFETFEVELQNILYNLYDPVYTPEAHIYPVFHLGPDQGLDALRAKIIAQIDALKSSTGYPQATKSDQLYDILIARFIQGLSQEKSAEQLGLSTRHLRRKQNEAVHALATRIWQAYQAAEEPAPPDSGEGASWAESMAHELEVLQKNAPETAADAGETLRRVVELAAYLPDSGQIALEVAVDAPQGGPREGSQGVPPEGSQGGPTPPEIKVPVHPAVLQQMLLNLIGYILHAGYRGPVRLACSESADAIVVSLALRGSLQPPELDIHAIRARVAVLGAALETQQSGEVFTIRLVFQKVRRVSVLVVDDNSQVVQLYRRYTANTRYDISHVASGAGLLQRLEAEPADILMIDILLPGIDGWELLLQLRRSPVTAGIPVIICSVLGNEEMARMLGAAHYLPKPIDRRSLLAALDDISPGRWQSVSPARTLGS